MTQKIVLRKMLLDIYALSMNWVVLLVFNQLETKVEGWLREKGVEVYLPMVREQRPLKRVRKNGERSAETVRPLFPGYAFAREDVLNYMNASPYTFRLLHFGANDVAMVDNDQINVLRERHDGDGFVRLPSKAPTLRQFKRNQRLKLLSGPFTGFNCLCANMVGTDRVAILLSALGRMNKFTVAAESLAAA